MVAGFVFIIYRTIIFWDEIPGALDPDAVTPMALGIVGVLLLAGIVIGIYFWGRRREIRDAEAEERRTEKKS
jgi:hypothetical protein